MIPTYVLSTLVTVVIACGPWIINLYSRISATETRLVDQADKIVDLKDDLKAVRTEADKRYELISNIAKDIAVVVNTVQAMATDIADLKKK